jgi:hypothetical protein
VRYTRIRDISEEERKELYGIFLDTTTSRIKYRAKIVLLAEEGYTIPEIRCMTNIYE